MAALLQQCHSGASQCAAEPNRLGISEDNIAQLVYTPPGACGLEEQFRTIGTLWSWISAQHILRSKTVLKLWVKSG